jgi:hypothetical protein
VNRGDGRRARPAACGVRAFRVARSEEDDAVQRVGDIVRPDEVEEGRDDAQPRHRLLRERPPDRGTGRERRVGAERFRT